MVYINQQAPPVRLHSYAPLVLPPLMIMPPMIPIPLASMFMGPRPPFDPRCSNGSLVGKPSFPPVELQSSSRVETPSSTNEIDVASRFRNSVRDRLGDELEEENEVQVVSRLWKVEVDRAKKIGDFVKTHQMTTLSDQVVRFACEYAATVREECRRNLKLEHQNDSNEKSSETPGSTHVIFNVDAKPFVPVTHSVKSMSNKSNNCDSTLTSPQVASSSTSDHNNSEEVDNFLKEFQLEKPIVDFTNDVVPKIVSFGRQSPGFNANRRWRAQRPKEQQISLADFDPVVAHPWSTVVETPLIPSLSTTQTSASSSTSEQETYIPWSEGLDEERIRYAQSYFNQLDSSM
ncbi:hypothetical protein M3Y95_01144000 [Aphelenchoides besseyi]|nr:hypothetical protein M3Y95_01144000 [Aphelenchoides besseyi]